MKETTAWFMTDAMRSTIRSGSGKAAKFLHSSMPEAGKSGTTQDGKNTWFVGYTPYYTAGIWSGTMSGKTKCNIAKMWRKIMETIIHREQQPIHDFYKPEGILAADICTKCGNIAIKGLCDQAVGGSCIQKEYFTSQTFPQKDCTCHAVYRICKKSGLPASSRCPSSTIEQKVYFIKKESKKDKTKDASLILSAKKRHQRCKLH